MGSDSPPWNLFSHRNLTYLEFEDLERLMTSLSNVHMSPLVTDARAWVPSSSGVFSVKSFFLALTNLSDSVPFYPTKFLWKLVLGTQYPRLFKVVLDKNIPISSVLGPTRPFSWNLNFRRNLSDYEIEDLEGLMRSLDGLHLSPSVPNARFWPLSSSGLFSVKSFFLALSQFSGSPQVFPSKFVWNSQVPFKVKSSV